MAGMPSATAPGYQHSPIRADRAPLDVKPTDMRTGGTVSPTSSNHGATSWIRLWSQASRVLNTAPPQAYWVMRGL